MFNEVEGLLQKVTSGEIDSSSVGQAASEHVSSLDNSQVQQHVQNAADTAQSNGQTDIAQQLTGLLSQHGNDPQGLKGEIVSLIQTNPQILTHFEPEFVKNLLSRV